MASKLFMEGKQLTGAVANALKINCKDKDGNKSTVQAELNDIQNNLGGLRFGVDGDGNYGYYGADDSLIPFNCIKLLWENPNPTSSFAAQTISLNLEKYKYLYIVSKGINSHTSNSYTIMKLTIAKDTSATAKFFGHADTIDYSSMRPVHCTDSGIVFGSGYRKYYGGTNNSNAYAIPIKIYASNFDVLSL